MEICTELLNAIKKKPFFNVVGGCGIDMSNGKSNCMSNDGIWFRYCPFCGKQIVSRFVDNRWNWKEK